MIERLNIEPPIKVIAHVHGVADYSRAGYISFKIFSAATIEGQGEFEEIK